MTITKTKLMEKLHESGILLVGRPVKDVNNAETDSEKRIKTYLEQI